jgi:integrase
MMGAGVRVDLKYVKPERGRDGAARYWYFRRGGRRWRLPGEPLSDPFMEAYRRLLDSTGPRTSLEQPGQYPPKSFGALALDYFASPEFRDRKPATQEMYRRIIEPLAVKNGAKPVALIERRHIKAWRDARAETPGMANMVVSVVRLLMTYAMDNDYRKDNPALRIKTFKLGEHRAWTPEELAAFERRWPPGTMQRRAYALARYTGQRRGDLAGMTRAHRRGGEIRVIQQKTGTELWIAEHRDLAAELARGGQGHLSLLTKSSGEAFSPEELGSAFGGWIEAAGLPDECVLHGLRKVAARDLAEAGCSAHEIMSVTGHKSLSEVERYTRAASQRRMSGAAILKLERNGKRTSSGKRSGGRNGKHRLNY